MIESTSRTGWWVSLVLILSLLAGNAYWIIRDQWVLKNIPTTVVAEAPVNLKVVNFLKLFIDKVLKADKEIDFETRLQLENGVRDLNDKEILAAWQKFTASKTEQEAQLEVNNLLTLLVGKLEAK
jgi:hypothetical protein